MPKAEITYQGGLSCTVKGTRFEEGKTRLITDPEIIQQCKNTATFVVRMVKEALSSPVKPTKKVLPVVKPKKKVVG